MKIFNSEWIEFTGTNFFEHGLFNEYSSLHHDDIRSMNRAAAALFSTQESQCVQCRLADARGNYQRFNAEFRAHPVYAGRAEGIVVEFITSEDGVDAAQ
ncbi:hypothetical protein [Sphingobium herbicidovorans]|uniref:hypothetical protein n=1 Tax=Sphingobium herbicidovorans TaxID=76947 RepID=UPI000ABBB586|nr:hypothetical protein [Sphingobium herbicidovorans]